MKIKYMDNEDENIQYTETIDGFEIYPKRIRFFIRKDDGRKTYLTQVSEEQLPEGYTLKDIEERLISSDFIDLTNLSHYAFAKSLQKVLLK